MGNEGNVKISYSYDMHDDVGEIPSSEPLKNALGYSQANILEAYCAFDRAALVNQKYHRMLAVIASVCGTVAVLFAIVQLSGFFPTSWPMWIEICVALIAFLAVVAGLVWSQQTRWLLNRHKAERYRMLKFISIIHPDLWVNNIEQWKNRVVRKVKEIEQMTSQSLRDWSTGDKMSETPQFSKCAFNEDAIRSLVDYYFKKRLGVQKTYFKKQEMRNKRLNRYTQNLPYLFYFLSVVAVLGHFMADILFGHASDIRTTSVTLIVLAASFPVLAAGVRTIRSAYEFARSAAIFHAKYAALDGLSMAIADEIKKSPVNKEAVLAKLWQCEQFLKAEHREWLRLMMEAEWFI